MPLAGAPRRVILPRRCVPLLRAYTVCTDRRGMWPVLREGEDVMPAYLVTRINSVADPVKFGEYRTRVAATHARYGARYLAAGPGERIEGTAQPVATVVLEFPDMEAIKR